MKKILLSIIISLTSHHSFAQTDIKPNDNTTQQNINVVPYRLFATQNLWIFIKLNTRTGQMWLVQFGLESDKRLVADLNSLSLVSTDKEANDRFTLYPTQNIYTFLLLDQLNGRTWQVQWSFDPLDRGIFPIK